jgi:hypothetical protein
MIAVKEIYRSMLNRCEVIVFKWKIEKMNNWWSGAMNKTMLPAVVVICLLMVDIYCQKGGEPEGYTQILSRGRIAAITQPDFVAANEAEIKADSWVLAVVIEGKARAYSLNLLNAHEVVNDRIDTTAFAAVW